METGSKRVLVTGAGGFIGSHMVAFLKEKGHWVRAVDKEWPEQRRHLWSQSDEVISYDLRVPTNGRVIVPDFTDVGSNVLSTVRRLIGDVSWTFHFAADMGGVGYFFSPEDGRASADNMQIDLNMLRAINPGQRMFYSSSFCAYPIKDQVLVNGKAKRAMTEEDFGPAPVEQIYGDEKRMATILFEDARKNKDLDIRSSFFSTVYGPYQETEDPKKSKFPTAICQKVSKGNPIELWGDGSQIRTYLYIDDAIEKMYRIMSADVYEGPVNIGSDEQVSCKEMADYVCELAGVEPKYEFNLNKPTGVMGKDTDNSKFNRLYGEVPQTSAREGFKRVYEWLTNEKQAKQT